MCRSSVKVRFALFVKARVPRFVGRGAIRSDLDRLRRRMSSKSERIKTLRALADECWAESEPSVARDTLDCLEVIVVFFSLVWIV